MHSVINKTMVTQEEEQQLERSLEPEIRGIDNTEMRHLDYYMSQDDEPPVHPHSSIKIRDQRESLTHEPESMLPSTPILNKVHPMINQIELETEEAN